MSKQPDRSDRSDRNIHFSGTLITALGLFAACVIFLTVSLGSYTLQDVQAYERLVRGIDEDLSSGEKSYVSSQQRTGLQKDVLFAGKEGALGMRLLSGRSDLALEKRGGRIAVVERMTDVTCFMQEEVLAILPDGRKAVRQSDGRFLIEGMEPSMPDAWLTPDLNAHAATPMQVVRRLDAHAATYHYQDDRFVAENVTVGRYLVSGHHLQNVDETQPLMRGIADSVEFSMKGSGRNFQAHRLKATFYSAREP